MRRTNFLFKFLLLIVNILTLNLAYYLAFIIRWPGFDEVIFFSQQYDMLLIYLNLVMIIVTIRDKTFTEFEKITPYKVLQSILKDCITVILSMFLFIVALKGYQYSRQFHLIFASTLIVFTFVFRYFNFGLLYVYKIRKQKLKRLMVLCLNEHLDIFIKHFTLVHLADFRVNGIYSLNAEKTANRNGLSVIPFQEIFKDLNHEIDELIIFFSDRYRNEIEKTIELAEARGIRVRMVPNYLTLGTEQLVLEYNYNLPLLRVRPEPLEDVNNYLLKRVFDIVASSFFLLLVFPIIYIIIAPLIKLSSQGPVFFKQLRTGQLNHEFYCLKFRTMKVNENADNLQASKNDPRKTWLGNFLRKTNIDELPQFINVLKGDMSIVGPRPHMLKHTEEYSEIIEKYKVRHFCKPGITGWAQVNGYRGETETPDLMRKRVEYDIWYIENWTFWLDIKIIFITIFNMFKGEEKAY